MEGKSVDWLLYDRDLRHEKVKSIGAQNPTKEPINWKLMQIIFLIIVRVSYHRSWKILWSKILYCRWFCSVIHEVITCLSWFSNCTNNFYSHVLIFELGHRFLNFLMVFLVFLFCTFSKNSQITLLDMSSNVSIFGHILNIYNTSDTFCDDDGTREFSKNLVCPACE